MDLGEIVWVIRRRWYIMVPTVIAAVALAAATYFVLPGKYQSTSTIALLNAQRPATATTPGQSNPFLAFDASLTATADFLARNLTSDATAQQLKQQGVTEEYTAALADNAQGPFVALTVTGTDKAQVAASIATLTSFASERLQQIQEQNGVPAGNMIHTAVIVPPQEPQQQLKNKVQDVAAVGLGCLTLAFMATFITEGLYRSRQRRRTASAPGTVVVSSSAAAASPATAGSATASSATASPAATAGAAVSADPSAPAATKLVDRGGGAPARSPANGASRGTSIDATVEMILTGVAEPSPPRA